jgi:hypothetical protein
LLICFRIWRTIAVMRCQAPTASLPH